ncbi:MAG: protein translocase SEC61 complex subunit gamma [Nanoarchaeota archaeon]|nr:protein translocase SEC61 complex subunit gamma [Nanoarchaeota archaeon]MBU1052027.1 protein translocase SEC61 complex subunit gamma [Nanoarchaeota archaeon]MBU1987886.1 protein translocase SEC61 complex subunit gamma [Nanoarchaeota archaeon]
MALASRLKSFILQSKRVWHVLKKPTSLEFKTVSKVSAIGILIIGAVGFLIADGMKLLGRLFS